MPFAFLSGRTIADVVVEEARWVRIQEGKRRIDLQAKGAEEGERLKAKKG